jgi:hypothetical protein
MAPHETAESPAAGTAATPLADLMVRSGALLTICSFMMPSG